MTSSELPRFQQDGGATGVARKYSKRVCGACRRRHYKCNGVGPQCVQCKIANLECIWSDKARAPSRSNEVAELRERLAILESTVEILVARSASPPGNSIATPRSGGSTSQWMSTPAPSDFASLLEPGTDPLDHVFPACSANPPSTLTWCAPSAGNDFTTTYQPTGNAPQAARATPPNASITAPDASTRPDPSSAANPSSLSYQPVFTPHPREGAFPEAFCSLHAEEDFANVAFGMNPDFLPETWWRGA